MKFLKFFTALLFFQLFLTSNVSADISGYGCKISSDYVYTQYLGKASAYTGTAPVHYFKSNGPKVPIYWGYGCNDCRGYRCGYINVYGATSYWDPSIKPNGGNVAVPAEQEFVSQNQQCVIAPSLGAPPVATDTYVYYSYDKTNKCSSTPPTNVPLDDHIWLLILAIGSLGFYTFKKQLIS